MKRTLTIYALFFTVLFLNGCLNVSPPKPKPYHATLTVDALQIGGQYAYTKIGSKLYIMRISETVGVEIIAVKDLTFQIKSLKLVGADLFVLNGVGYMHIINVSNPSQPQEYSNKGAGFYIGGGADQIAVSGNYAYVTRTVAGMAVIEIKNKANPTQIGVLEGVQDADKIAVNGEYAYIANKNFGIQVVDIGNPHSLKIVDVISIKHINRLYATNAYLYAANSNGIYIIKSKTNKITECMTGPPDRIIAYNNMFYFFTPAAREGITINMQYCRLQNREFIIQYAGLRLQKNNFIEINKIIESIVNLRQRLYSRRTFFEIEF